MGGQRCQIGSYLCTLGTSLMALVAPTDARMSGLRRPQTQKLVEVIFYYFLTSTQQYKTSNQDLSAFRMLSDHLVALLARQQFRLGG